MHWIIQSNLHQDESIKKLLDVLERSEISYSLHKVIPFSGEIEPDIEINGPVIVWGSYSMRHVAKRKQWKPGCFDIGHLTYADHIKHWGEHMLNNDSIFTTFGNLINILPKEEFFMRPVVDSKFFAGMVIEPDSFKEWHKKIVILKEDYGDSLSCNTEIMIASIKHLMLEYRVCIVDKKPITASLYKRGGRVLYSEFVDDFIFQFAAERAQEWEPAKAYVMDIGILDNKYKIIETNTINAAGLYHCDIGKLVYALEDLK